MLQWNGSPSALGVYIYAALAALQKAAADATIPAPTRVGLSPFVDLKIAPEIAPEKTLFNVSCFPL